MADHEKRVKSDFERSYNQCETDLRRGTVSSGLADKAPMESKVQVGMAVTLWSI
ncbi:hypothetical protein [Novosphingobium kaempferiae]|uniref:hypothetical protein n=1 Tax=Novosphingobium kaempferiae TaxID=2896849 RepID=UPI001E28F99A|nr:hypothetical protein [Novosphingobium kaempferiae]